MIWLKLPAAGFENKNLESLFAHFRASISITGDGGGYRDIDESVTECPHRLRSREGWISLLQFSLLGKGTRQVKVVIHQGVPELKGIPQQLEERYDSAVAKPCRSRCSTSSAGPSPWSAA